MWSEGRLLIEYPSKYGVDIVRAPGKTNFANGESPPKILKSNDLLAKFVENNESLINGIFCDM